MVEGEGEASEVGNANVKIQQVVVICMYIQTQIQIAVARTHSPSQILGNKGEMVQQNKAQSLNPQPQTLHRSWATRAR